MKKELISGTFFHLIILWCSEALLEIEGVFCPVRYVNY